MDVGIDPSQLKFDETKPNWDDVQSVPAKTEANPQFDMTCFSPHDDYQSIYSKYGYGVYPPSNHTANSLLALPNPTGSFEKPKYVQKYMNYIAPTAIAPRTKIRYPLAWRQCTSSGYSGREDQNVLFSGFFHIFQFELQFENYLNSTGLHSPKITLPDMVDRLTNYTYQANLGDTTAREATSDMIIQIGEMARNMCRSLDMECPENIFWEQCKFIGKKVMWNKKPYTVVGRLLSGCYMIDSHKSFETASSGITIMAEN